MANFLHATDLGSDSEDSDYNPAEDEGKVVSEEEDDGDLADGKESAKKKKSSKVAPVAARRGGLFDEDDDPDEAEARKREFAKEKEEIKEKEEEKKIDDLWADFKKDSSSKTKSKVKVGAGLGSICSVSKSDSKPKTVSNRPKPAIRNIFDDIEVPVIAEKKDSPPKTKAILSVFDRMEEEDKSQTGDSKKNESAAESDDTMKITKVFDFAGENVSVTKEVSKDSKEAKQFLKKQEESQASTEKTPVEAALAALKRPASSSGGLGSIMDQISGKKTKMGCLDKSKMDWNSFVDTEGLREDLTTHNRGKEGYVEKQEFLDRADQRRFEVEKAAREKTRKTINR